MSFGEPFLWVAKLCRKRIALPVAGSRRYSTRSARDHPLKVPGVLDRLSFPYLTLHRSWMLCDRAFGQFASTCRRSESLASPYCSMSLATL
jgi:hypothetical protein